MSEAGPQGPLHLRFVALNHGPDALGNAPLTTGLTRHLAALGHRVQVFTAWPHHDTGHVPRGAWRRLGRHTEANVEVFRVPVPGPKSTPWGRMATHASFVAWALAASQLTPEAPDVQVVPLPPLSAAWLPRAARVPLVLDVQDVFPLNLASVAAEHPRWGTPGLAAATRLARSGYRRATHLRALGPAAAAALATLGVPARRISVIANPANLDELHPEGPCTLRARISPDGGPIALLSGRLGAALDLATLAKAWPQVLAAWPTEAGPAPWLALVGSGSHAKVAESLADSLPQVRHLPLQPIEFLGDLLRSCTVGLVPLRVGAAAASLPSRTLNLWACARPVVLSAESGTDAARQIHAAAGGETVAPGDARALAGALLARLTQPAKAEAEGREGLAWVRANASPRGVAEQWSSMLNRVVSARGPR